MKFLFRSGWGESLALARRVESEGNLVRFCVVEKSAQKVGQGLITKTKDYLGSVGWADVIVYDSNPFGMDEEAERARGAGKNVVGSSKLSGKLEHDRIFAIDIAQAAGIEVPYYWHFTGKDAWSKARKFLAEHGDEDEDGWVWKHNGDSEAASTFVGPVEEMLRMLTYFEGLYVKAKESPDFILTTKISGIEVSTEAWFNGEDFVLANHTLEKNKFFNGDLGEKTGCAGNVVWAYSDVEDCPLYGKLLAPLKKALQGKYRGPIDVNALIDEEHEEPIFLEFTPRFGYDAIFGLGQLLSSDLAGLLADVAAGGRWKGSCDSNGFAGALRIHTPPYPEEEPGRAEEIPIFGFDAENVSREVSPCEVMLDGLGQPITSGPNGYVFVLSKTAESPKATMDIDVKIKVPLMRYRTDLGEMLQECYDELAATKWLGGRQRRRLFGR